MDECANIRFQVRITHRILSPYYYYSWARLDKVYITRVKLTIEDHYLNKTLVWDSFHAKHSILKSVLHKCCCLFLTCLFCIYLRIYIYIHKIFIHMLVPYIIQEYTFEFNIFPNMVVFVSIKVFFNLWSNTDQNYFFFKGKRHQLRWCQPLWFHSFWHLYAWVVVYRGRKIFSLL